MDSRIKKIFALSRDIRYVAMYRRGKLVSEVAPNLKNTSSSESDKYEELIVNPTLLLLAKQRGNIDCGGCDYLLIRYGHFFEFVHALKEGHVSVGIEPKANPMKISEKISAFIRKNKI